MFKDPPAVTILVFHLQHLMPASQVPSTHSILLLLLWLLILLEISNQNSRWQDIQTDWWQGSDSEFVMKYFKNVKYMRFRSGTKIATASACGVRKYDREALM